MIFYYERLKFRMQKKLTLAGIDITDIETWYLIVGSSTLITLSSSSVVLAIDAHTPTCFPRLRVHVRVKHTYC